MNTRRISKAIKIGDVTIGGGAPIVVQSMTKTDTRDVKATVRQIKELEECGCEIIRVAVPDAVAAGAILDIKKSIKIPLVADIHYDHKLALASLKAGIAKLRINPGNIGGNEKVREVALAAADKGVPIRIGGNKGSLHRRYEDLEKTDPAGALVQSALDEIATLAEVGFHDVAVSLKSSDPREVVQACRRFAALSDVPQHLGVTEAGTLLAGTSRSIAAMSVLLAEGIGDTVRISLADDPVHEVTAAFHMLQSLGLREGFARVVACPTCGRVEVDVVGLAKRVEELTGVVLEQIDSLKTVGTTDVYVTKVKEISKRHREVQLRENDFWVSSLTSRRRESTPSTKIGRAPPYAPR